MSIFAIWGLIAWTIFTYFLGYGRGRDARADENRLLREAAATTAKRISEVKKRLLRAADICVLYDATRHAWGVYDGIGITAKPLCPPFTSHLAAEHRRSEMSRDLLMTCLNRGLAP